MRLDKPGAGLAMRGFTACWVLFGTVIATSLAGAGVGEEIAAAEDFDDCPAIVQRYPHELKAYSCYYRIALTEKRLPEAAQRLEALLAIDPANHRAKYYLGHVEGTQEHERSEILFLEALEGFVREEDLAGEVLARNSLAYWYTHMQEDDAADAQLRLAGDAAEASGRADLVARVKALHGFHAMEREQYGRAWFLLKQAEQAVFPDGARHQQIQVVQLLASTAERLGRYADALEMTRRWAELLNGAGMASAEAAVRINTAQLSRQVRIPRRYSLEEQCALAGHALEAARAAGSVRSEATAALLSIPCVETDMRRALLERVLTIDREAGRPSVGTDPVPEALCRLAEDLLRRDSAQAAEAFALVERAIARARRRGPGEARGLALYARARLNARLGRHGEALADGLEALDTIESTRDLQGDGEVRARIFARHVPRYRGLAGYVLDRSPSAGTDEIEIAFRIMERMRARVLLDELDVADASTRRLAATPERERRDEILRRISNVQQRLMQQLSDNDREAALVELEGFELDESVLRGDLARADPIFSALRTPHIPTIVELQRHLAADQAMLAFQLDTDLADPADRWGGGSWVLTITRDTVDATPLAVDPAIDGFRGEIDLFFGLLRRRDGSERRAGARLYQMLVEPALRDLPAGVKRLVIIPDGTLSKLPLGVLRPAPDADPLGTAYQISRTPSAALWVRWRGESPEGGSIPVLAFADPSIQGDRQASVFRSAGMFLEPFELGPLPYARSEVRALVRRFGGGSRMLAGADATEHAMKRTPLESYRVLHFAAHALIDERTPGRSAVVLAPGSDGEDGLLQLREIVELDLAGQVVILSACHSASGLTLEGEGVVGLARGFFQAGAHAVVGSLWPLRDEEAAELVDDLAYHLAEGASVTASLAAAQGKWIAGGRPAAAWAGLVVIGDGDRVPFPGGLRPFPLRRVVAVAAVSLLAGAIAVWRFRHRRRP